MRHDSAARTTPTCVFAICALALGACVGAPAMAASPTNDLCGNAAQLTRGVAVSGTNAEATSDSAESACGFNDSKDVWYTFTSTEFANYRIQTDRRSAIDTTLAAYSSGCGGQLRGCNDDSPDAGPGEHWSRIDVQMSPGQTIKIRVAGWNGATGTFGLLLDYVPIFHPVFDECAAALPVTFPSSTNTTTVGCTGTDITSCGEDDFYDAWYFFTAPTDGTYRFFATNTDIFGLFFGLFSTCGGTELACGLRDISLRMTAGESILIRAAFIGGTAGTFTLNVGPLPTVVAPPNDDCSGALPVLGLGTTVGTTVGATGFDTGYIFGCTLTDTGPGVWYQFVAPDAGIYQIDTDGSDLQDTAIVLFGACAPNGGAGGNELRGCDDNLGVGLHSKVLWQAGAAGDAVYIVVAGQHLTSGLFHLNISTNLFAPINDTCAGAIDIASPSVTPGDNFLARDLDITPSVCDEGRFAMFYHFVAPQTDTFRFDVLDSPDLPYGGVAVYDTCRGHELACGPDRTVRLAMRVGDDVIVRVTGSLAYRGPFNLRVGPAEVGPVNDHCDAAQPIAFGQSIHATNRGATGSVSTGNCGSPEATDPADVWYAFTPPADAVYTFTASGFIHPGLSLFTDCWPAAPDAIACVDGCQTSTTTLSQPLSAGQTVKIRVTSCFLGFGGLKEFGSFTLSVGNTSLGSCCSGATCRIDSSTGCSAAFERYNGPGTACNASAISTTPCCRADFNHIGGLSVQDIFDFLNAWFAGNPAADFNGGGLSVQDIFDYLNSWFAGC